ncbi:MAG: hypothetical protein K1X94_08070 [Sandaracinaceae bacterium]|nr:hypothetical protein [Sandaracinaceae bacterium]
MIRIVYFVGHDEDRVAAEVTIDDEGRVDVVHGEVRAHGILAETTRRRLAADVATTRYARLGRRVGRGASLARIEAPSGTILAAFDGDVQALAPQTWPPPVARHARDLALVARATLDGALPTLSLELPDVVREEHLLLSFDLGSESARGHTTFVYDDGTCERWKLLDARRGERVRREHARVEDVRGAHAAATRLLDAVRAAGPAPEMTAAHDPTDALDLELVRDGRTESWATTWGRASRNDAVLEPVNSAVPLALFEDLVARLRALRDAPTVPFSVRPAHAPEALPTLAWGDVTPVDPPRAGEPPPSAPRPAPIAQAPGAPPARPPPARPPPVRPPARAGRAVEEIVHDLVAFPPRTLRALEASIGALEGFARSDETIGWIARDDHPGLAYLHVRYDFDLDHESPYFQGDPRDPALTEVDLGFARGLLGHLGWQGPVPELLASRLGAATPYRRGERSGLRFGDHWFAGRDGHSLAYVAERLS